MYSVAYCNLLKEENIHKVNCEVDFHFQTFYQKYIIYGKPIKLCVSPAAVVYLTFCQQAAHFFGDKSLYNFCSLHVC